MGPRIWPAEIAELWQELSRQLAWTSCGTIVSFIDRRWHAKAYLPVLVKHWKKLFMLWTLLKAAQWTIGFSISCALTWGRNTQNYCFIRKCVGSPKAEFLPEFMNWEIKFTLSNSRRSPRLPICSLMIGFSRCRIWQIYFLLSTSWIWKCNSKIGKNLWSCGLHDSEGQTQATICSPLCYGTSKKMMSPTQMWNIWLDLFRFT